MRDALYVPGPGGAGRLVQCDVREPQHDRADGVMALIEHGEGDRPGRLQVTFEPTPWRPGLTPCVAAHRIGWLRPSVLQRRLRLAGRTVWGSPAALAAVPDWPAEQIDPLDALDEIAAAEWLAPDERCAARAIEHAVAALLVVRRAYTSLPSEQIRTLAALWPGLARPDADEPAAFVASARRLVSDWLFEWDAVRMRPAARRAFAALRGHKRLSSPA